MYKLVDILKEVREDIKFTQPNFEEEWGEAKRYSDLFPDKKTWLKAVRFGKVETIDCSMDIQNTDMCDGDLNDLEPAKVARAMQALDRGVVELPIVLKVNGEYELLGGNTRATALAVNGLPVKAWVIDMSKVNETTLREVGEDLSSAYNFEYVGGFNPTYTFSTGETEYKVVFRDEEGGTYERMYMPIQKKSLGKGETTGEGKAIPVNATVMAITLDFLENNKDWHTVTIHPIDPRRHRLVTSFVNKNLPKNKYNVEDIDGILNITRKIR
jgi:hypothetical protein